MRLELFDAKDLNFVELNITGSNDSYVRCDKESKYVESTVFNIFAHSFENANKLYEYFGPTKYNSRKIIPLRNELLKYKEQLDDAESADDFKEVLESTFLGKEFIDELTANRPGWEDNYEYFLNRILKINEQLIGLAELCADQERILWVIGY